MIYETRFGLLQYSHLQQAFASRLVSYHLTNELIQGIKFFSLLVPSLGNPMTKVPHTVQCLWCEEYRTEVIHTLVFRSTVWLQSTHKQLFISPLCEPHGFHHKPGAVYSQVE